MIPLGGLRTGVKFPGDDGSLAGLADKYEIVVTFDHCLELRFDVARLEQEVGWLASRPFVRLGRHADMIHAARVRAFADDLEVLRRPPAPSDDVFVYLPKQDLVLGHSYRSLVHNNLLVAVLPAQGRSETRHEGEAGFVPCGRRYTSSLGVRNGLGMRFQAVPH